MITGLFILPKARQKTELFLTRRAGSQSAGEEGVGTLNKQQLEACKWMWHRYRQCPKFQATGPGCDDWWMVVLAAAHCWRVPASCRCWCDQLISLINYPGPRPGHSSSADMEAVLCGPEGNWRPAWVLYEVTQPPHNCCLHEQFVSGADILIFLSPAPAPALDQDHPPLTPAQS